MKVLELFAGSRSVGKEAEKMGMQVWSIDIEPFDGIDEVMDILQFDPQTTKMPFAPDIIWFSIPCTTYSIASCGHHRNMDKSPKTEDAILGDKLAIKTLSIVGYYLMRNKNLLWFGENPRGILRKMPFMEGLPRHTVTYCQYGDFRMKPTDIWTNCHTWKPRPMCSNGDKCHESAPRGSKTGTQGLKGAYLRSVIPAELCREILEAAKLALINTPQIKQYVQKSLFAA